MNITHFTRTNIGKISEYANLILYKGGKEGSHSYVYKYKYNGEKKFPLIVKI